jgi:signal transduction histidine kinase
MVTRSLVSLFSTANSAPVDPWKLSESSVPHASVLKAVRLALAAGIGYYVGTRVGFALTPTGQPNSAFWPANAVLLAALLLAPRRIWWALLVAVIPAHFLAQLQAGVPVWTAAAWLTSNTSEALIGAFCIAQFVRPTRVFDTARGVFIFVLFGVLIAPFATSFLDAAGVVLTGWGRGYLLLGAGRFWTNALAELTIVPVIVLCASNVVFWKKHATLIRCCEAALLGVSTVLATFLVFGFEPFSPSLTPALLFLPLALLFWATARFGWGGLSLCLLIISMTAIWYVVHGREPFPHASLRQNVVSLQILLCTVVLPLMFVSAFMTEARHAQESLRRMSANLINAQEQERTRIGRELHDDVNQKLAMLSVRLQQLRENPSDVNSHLQELRQEVDDISSDVQALSHELHSSKLEYLGFVKGIESWCKEFAERQRIEIDFRSDVTSVLPFEVGVSLFRVLQEALHNAVKHSGVKHVEVQLTQHSGEIHLTVTDSGKGFDIESAMRGKGMGLISMRERVRLLHGTLAIKSRPMGGTAIDVRLPLLQDGSPRVAA